MARLRSRGIAPAVRSMGISVREIAKVECFGSTVEGMSTIGKAAVGDAAADAKLKMMVDTTD